MEIQLPPLSEKPPVSRVPVKKVVLIAVLAGVVLFFVGALATFLLMRAPETMVPQESESIVVPSENKNALSVRFVTPPEDGYQKESVPDVFVPLFKAANQGISLENYQTGKPYTDQELIVAMEAYTARVGTVEGGVYDGYTLNMVHWMSLFEIGSTNNEVYYLLDSEKNVTLLGKYAVSSFFFGSGQKTLEEFLGEDVFAEYVKTQKIEDDLVIEAFEIPSVLKDEQGNEFAFISVSGLNDKTNTEPTKTSAVSMTDSKTGKVYSLFADDSAYAFTRPDTRIVRYNYVIPWNTDEKAEVYWNDGTIMGANLYASQISTGCGHSSPDLVTEIPTLKLAGHVTGSDKKTYEFFQPVWTEQDVADPDSVANMYYVNYEQRLSWNDHNKIVPSFEGFMNMHPVFLWKDPLGRWLRFTHENVQSAAECGKPVIYLYPTEKIDLDVTVAPKGGFTFTEPVYNNGWRVTASPDGTLVNRDDGKTYPYLFWEGHGDEYGSPEDYWVVARQDVPVFLKKTLADIGLNSKEIADFMEFWEPKMRSAPYYKIGFHGTRVMDFLAPLTISEKPDMILRVLMDYTELQEPITQHPPQLPPTLVRKGFTVIEWGGVLR